MEEIDNDFFDLSMTPVFYSLLFAPYRKNCFKSRGFVVSPAWSKHARQTLGFPPKHAIISNKIF
jgi:hypothetical protein